jgi:hypothetical protein
VRRKAGAAHPRMRRDARARHHGAWRWAQRCVKSGHPFEPARERPRRTTRPGTRAHLDDAHGPPSSPATTRRSSANAPEGAGAVRQKVATSAPVRRTRHPFVLQPREPHRTAGTSTRWPPRDRRKRARRPTPSTQRRLFNPPASDRRCQFPGRDADFPLLIRLRGWSGPQFRWRTIHHNQKSVRVTPTLYETPR